MRYGPTPRSMAIDPIRPLPKHCLQGAGYIFATGLVGTCGKIPFRHTRGIQLLPKE
jgi:hypothetical protein